MIILLFFWFNKLQAQATFIFKQYDLKEFGKYLPTISSDTIYYFDLDNTLIYFNDYSYGSDGWTDVIKDSIEQGSQSERERLKNTLYEILTPANYSILPVFPVDTIYPRLLNAALDKKININGLTSRGDTLDVITLQNLKNCGYKMNSIFYTKGGNKGLSIWELFQKDQNNKNIVYVDDTLEKLKQAADSLYVKFRNTKDVTITLIHLKNINAKKYTVNCVTSYHEGLQFENLNLCSGTNIISREEALIYWTSFKIFHSILNH